MKVRSDFVSNSSSSSFIVATKYNDLFDGAYNICNALGDGDFDLIEMLEKRTSLTLFDIRLCFPHGYDSIPAGITIDDEDLSEYFDGDEVRKDLDPHAIIRKLLWHKYPDDKDIFIDPEIEGWCENEYVVYENRILGKVNIKTYNFTKWLCDAIKDQLGEFTLEMQRYEPEKDAEYYLNKIKSYLDDNKMIYQIYCSYMGNGQEYGHVYLSDVKTPTSTKLLKAGVIQDVNDMWYAA